MLHKHLVKHAKRAHAHIQNHGHKWLWLLSGVFFFILIYPYFSNAQGIGGASQDICPNGDNSPTYYDCLCETGGETSEDICPIEESNDLCPNIDGIDEVIPAGQELVNGECVPIQEPTIEVCEDEQANNFEEQGDCTYDTVVVPLTGTITYTPSISTTGTVVATVTGFSTTGVTVTSTGGATYTFTGNRSHIFTFTNTQGATGSATAMVDWITVPSTPLVTPGCTQPNLNFVTPASGAVVSGRFSIARTGTDSSCLSGYSIGLLDHNNQRINFGRKALSGRFQVYERGLTGLNFTTTGQFNNTITFDSTLLVYTGYYTITGVHLSGTTYSGVTYTQDTTYNIYTGGVVGAYTNFATGYKLRLMDSNENVLVQSNGTFTIDNQKPLLTSLTGSFAPVVSGQIGKAGIMTASFISSEQLTGGTTFTILGTNVTPTSVVQNGSTYSYTVPLSSIVASGALTFTANVADLAGNTGAVYGTSSIILKNQIPSILNLAFTGGTSGSIGLGWTTDISTKYNFSYVKSGTTSTTYFTGTAYSTTHNYTMTGIQNNNKYIFTIAASDNLANTRVLSGVLNVSTTGVISMTFPQSDIAVYLSGQVEASIYLQILQNEINKFKACKAAITFTDTTIPVGTTKSIVIKKPTISKNSVQQTMNVFLLLFVNKIKEKTTLSQAELNTVADAINNFLVVIKLVDDDESDCEQKMSTYYLSQFEQLMSSMDFF